MNIGEIIIEVHPGLGGWDTFQAHISHRMTMYFSHAQSGFFCIEMMGKGY